MPLEIEWRLEEQILQSTLGLCKDRHITNRVGANRITAYLSEKVIEQAGT